MDKVINYPIQMICVVNANGSITPMRFRYEDDSHKLYTVNIDEIHAHNEVHVAGTTSIIYTCSAIINNEKALFSLKYTVPTHKWIFHRRLS